MTDDVSRETPLEQVYCDTCCLCWRWPIDEPAAPPCPRGEEYRDDPGAECDWWQGQLGQPLPPGYDMAEEEERNG